MNNSAVQIGLERCIADPPTLLRDKRFGLLMNHASVDSEFRYAADVLAACFPGQLAAIFSPQHGLWGEAQANMIESSHAHYAPLNLPIYSLYSETRRPKPEMLAGLDCLVIDLQDVGTRVYTFAWTVLHCLEACAEAGMPILILDRPNPLGGTVAEGPLLDSHWRSFVGGGLIPLRHGLTLGELALLLNSEQQIGAGIHVVPMAGWRRTMLFAETGRTWVAPSPNMPRVETTLLYPGQVLLEGTNISEGRGTTLPFEVAGAPFIDPDKLAAELSAFTFPGVRFRPIRFVPTFDKWQGQSCGGVAIHIVDAPAVRSVQLTVALLAAIARLYPHDFRWLDPPYEYEREKMPIDILFGSPQLRQALAKGPILGPAEIESLAALDIAAWWDRVNPFLLYGQVPTEKSP